MVNNYTEGEWFPWLYGGVDFDLEGNGGPECLHYLTIKHRFWETVLVLLTSLIEIWVALKYINRNSTRKQNGAVSYTQACQCAEKNGVVHTIQSSNEKR